MISTQAAPYLLRSRWTRSRRVSRLRSAHLVGVCGSGMKALAECLLDLGWRVTGSDLQSPSASLAPLQRRGLRIHQGHHPGFLPADVDVLVYSPAVGIQNPERRLARHLNIQEMSYAEMLGLLMCHRIGISIAGTHGKSTTTAMTATLLADAGLSPSAAMGAELKPSGLSGWAGDGPHFVVESCEYQRSFLHLSPTYAAILGIESDHFDCYRNLEELEAAFFEFAKLLPSNGLLLTHADCPISQSVARRTEVGLETFSFQPEGDWWAADLRPIRYGTRFRIFYRGDYFTEVVLRVPGAHNVLNGLAAAALAHHAGVSSDVVRESLGEFQGIRRRFEILGSWRGVTFIDDYAHHPTSVRATLETARQQFGDRRLWCVFQPHQTSRTQRLMDEFSASFGAADELVLAPVFAARETDADCSADLSSQLASQVSAKGQRVRCVSALDQAIATLEDETLPGDVVIAMGAGDITRVSHEFTGRVRRHHAVQPSFSSADVA